MPKTAKKSKEEIEVITKDVKEELKPEIKKLEEDKNVDNILVDDIELTVANDEQFYRSTHIPFVKNYQRKIAKGTFNTELGIKGLRNNAVPRAVKRYNEITKPTDSLFKLNKDEKELLAKQLLDRVLNSIDDGEGN